MKSKAENEAFRAMSDSRVAQRVVNLHEWCVSEDVEIVRTTMAGVFRLFHHGRRVVYYAAPKTVQVGRVHHYDIEPFEAIKLLKEMPHAVPRRRVRTRKLPIAA